MNFIRNPNIPDRKVTLAMVDGRISSDPEDAFKRLNIEILKTSRHTDVYDAVAYHPDIAFHHISYNKIIYAPGTDQLLVDNLKQRGFVMIEGTTRLSCSYPQSAAYNVARIGNIAFHNLNITDPVLKKALEEEGVRMVHVRQGYSRCSTSILNENSIITSDKGIAEAALKNGINVLLIEPQRNIVLPGLDYGFLGGSSGLIDKNTWAIAGNLERLEAGRQIAEYLNKAGVKLVNLSDDYVMDIGTIVPLMTE